MTPIQQLAREYRNMFVLKDRRNTGSEPTKFYCVEDEYMSTTDYFNSPLCTLIRTAHGDMFPDDYKYQYVVDALDLIMEYDDLDDVVIESDISNYDLITWLRSHGERPCYCEQSMLDFGAEQSFMEIIRQGQWLERDEVLQSVRSSLESIIEQQEESHNV